MFNGYIVREEELKSFVADNTEVRRAFAEIEGKSYEIKRYKYNQSEIFSEYVASHIVQSLGIKCQNAWIGYNDTDNKRVSIAEDFRNAGEKFISFTCNSSENSECSLTQEEAFAEEVEMLLNNDKMIQHSEMKDKIKKHLYEQLICDAIVDNKERNRENCGYIYIQRSNTVKNAPIFGFVNCLGAGFEDEINNWNRQEEIDEVVRENLRNDRLVWNIAGSSEQGRRQELSYYDILNTEKNSEIRQLKESFRKIIDFDKFMRIVREVTSLNQDIFPQNYKNVYRIMLGARYLRFIEGKTIDESCLRAVMKVYEQ